MSHSPKNQARYLITESGIRAIGTSRHAAKEAANQEHKLQQEMAGVPADQTVGMNKHELNKNLGIHSHSTCDTYEAVIVNIIEYCRNLPAPDRAANMYKITADNIRAWAASRREPQPAKIDSEGMPLPRQYRSAKTLRKELSAAEKMETMLNKLDELKGREVTRDWSAALAEARSVITEDVKASNQESRFRFVVKDRAYADCIKVAECLKNEKYRLAAKAQIEGGARMKEVNNIHANQLKGLITMADGSKSGQIAIKGKGGYPRTISVSEITYQSIKAIVEQKGQFRFTPNRYDEAIKKACAKTGQDYNGSHGFRYNSVQIDYFLQRLEGVCRAKALKNSSETIGHHRADITQHYLGFSGK